MSTTDLVERLLFLASGQDDDTLTYTAWRLIAEAAAEIEKLRAANARMRADCKDAGNALGDVEAENERLRAALAESCDEHRSAVYDTTTGGGCVLLRDAVAAERERCAKLVETLRPCQRGDCDDLAAAIREA